MGVQPFLSKCLAHFIHVDNTPNIYPITIASHALCTTMCLDAAHGGWLGWSDNMAKFVQILKELPYSSLRGFATNVANYQPIGEMCPW